MTTTEVRPARTPSPRVRVVHQLVRYVAFGGVGAASDLAVFTALNKGMHVDPVPANIVSVLVGIAVSFALNSRLTFNSRDRHGVRGAKFFTVGLLGLLLSTVLLHLLTDDLGVKPLLSKVITLPIVAVTQFVANRYWTFADLRDEPAER